MRCINCNKPGQVIDLSDEPVFIEQHLAFLSGDKEDLENHHECVLQINADRAWGTRRSRRFQLCQVCFTASCARAVEVLFKHRGIPRAMDGEKE